MQENTVLIKFIQGFRLYLSKIKYVWYHNTATTLNATNHETTYEMAFRCLKRQLLLQFFRTITWGSADNNWRREISVQDVISGLFILIVVFSYYFVISKSLISNPPEAAVRPLGNWYREFSTWESTIWNRCSISIIQCKIYFTHGFVFLLVVCVILI